VNAAWKYFQSHLSVCLSVYHALTFKSLDPESSIFSKQVHLQNIYVKFVYQGHRVKIKITAAKSVAVYPVHGGLPSTKRQSCT